MNATQLFGRALLIGVAGLGLLHASDFTGVYAWIDKVVLEPNSDSPERIQVWGVFSPASPADPRAICLRQSTGGAQRVERPQAGGRHR